MKSIGVVVVLLFVSVSIFGQEQIEKKTNIELKLYLNNDEATSSSVTNLNSQFDSTTNTNVRENLRIDSPFGISPAVVVKKENGNSHELELSRLKYLTSSQVEINQRNAVDSTFFMQNGVSQSLFDLHLRYEYKVALFKKKQLKKLKPIVGFSASPFFTRHSLSPMNSVDFPVNNTSAGVYFSVIPRLEYSLNKKWYLDANIPLSISTFSYSVYRKEDPTVPVEARSNTTINLDTSLNLFFRFGVGVRL